MGGEDVLGSEFGGAGGVPDLRDLVADDFAHEALRRGRLAFGGDREGAAGSAVRDDPARGPDAEELERRLAAGGAVRLEGASEPDALPVADEGQAGERPADAGGGLQDAPFASVRRDAAAYYQSGINGAPCFTDGAVTSFLQSFAAALPSDVKGGIKVHRVALYGYDASGQDRMLTYQASVEYADTADAVRQKRLVLKYIAAFSADPASDVKTCNCPNCGAPVPVIGSKNCRYCGAALKTPAGLGWMLLDAREG